MIDDRTSRLRWRLILGRDDREGGGGADGGSCADMDEAGMSDKERREWAERERLLGYLYDREYGEGRNVRNKQRGANLGESTISVPDWINGVQELFPKSTCEKLEADALERYKLEGFITDPDVLSRATPSEGLLKSILRTKNLMNQEVLAVARDLVRKVVQSMMEKLARPISQPFSGVKNRRMRSLYKVNQNFDAKTTIRKNLKHWDAEHDRIVIEQPFFFSRLKKKVDRWQIIILVDQSGSMVNSVIHSAITASIFHQMPFMKTHLIAFDTNVVDLTSESIDPVETLMKVQLGGGTDIGGAVSYAARLVEDGPRTIMILISDFYEGGHEMVLLSQCRRLLENRVKLLCLAALDDDTNPNFDRVLAGKLANMGAEVAAMTPGELANWVAEKVNAP